MGNQWLSPSQLGPSVAYAATAGRGAVNAGTSNPYNGRPWSYSVNPNTLGQTPEESSGGLPGMPGMMPEGYNPLAWQRQKRLNTQLYRMWGDSAPNRMGYINFDQLGPTVPGAENGGLSTAVQHKTNNPWDPWFINPANPGARL